MALSPQAQDIQLKLQNAIAAVQACVSSLQTQQTAIVTNDGGNMPAAQLIGAAVTDINSWVQRFSDESNGLTDSTAT